ncbi:unnamed protein product [Tenebrio molitor]|nr:unnamed protein product [Tenebrio molitor]
MPPACFCQTKRTSRAPSSPDICWPCCGSTTTSSPATEYGRSFSAG